MYGSDNSEINPYRECRDEFTIVNVSISATNTYDMWFKGQRHL